ncbi:MAG TPA: SDR family oxidoreductase [bacterium]|nr:SDR family oxidoreductase [bacterium]
MQLAGAVAVVTGAGRGIGYGIARRLAKEGARVVVNDRVPSAVTAVEEDLRRSADIMGYVADVSSSSQVAEMFRAIRDRWGRVDILVNNAALVDVPRHFLLADEAYWDELIAVNLKGVYLCSRQAAALMVRQRAGCIIHISSAGAVRAQRLMVAYDAAKGAVEAATRAMAVDLAPYGIRVNAVGPAAIRTETWDAWSPEVVTRMTEGIPLGRPGTAEDVAACVAFLASGEATFITGQVIYVDGGILAQLRSPQVDASAWVEPGDISIDA